MLMNNIATSKLCSTTRWSPNRICNCPVVQYHQTGHRLQILAMHQESTRMRCQVLKKIKNTCQLKEQEMMNEDQTVKLDDAEYKLKDQGHQLKAQQKRIGSTEKTLHALCEKLNLPLPSTMFVPAQDELRTSFNDNILT
ncbi:uncharacterized protein LOC130933100 [Arachis stenosperma]|uniref:uncharacterized protein LOC130933100 n=1 Tax=Arachis stenosperma TaxID=217475 RepID=UPI0025AC36AD|nr:uncharacterized protein LOC130933100 [Arachis stenosperma]